MLGRGQPGQRTAAAGEHRAPKRLTDGEDLIPNDVHAVQGPGHRAAPLQRTNETGRKPVPQQRGRRDTPIGRRGQLVEAAQWTPGALGGHGGHELDLAAQVVTGLQRPATTSRVALPPGLVDATARAVRFAWGLCCGGAVLGRGRDVPPGRWPRRSRSCSPVRCVLCGVWLWACGFGVRLRGRAACGAFCVGFGL